MDKKYIVFLFIISINGNFFAQQNLVDSLIIQLGSVQGIEKANLYNEISKLTEDDYAISLEYSELALALSQRLNYKLGNALAYKNIGQVYYNQHKYNLALEYYTNSKNIFENIPYDSLLATLHQKIGYTHHKLNEHESAIENMKIAGLLRSELNDKYGLASSYANIGYIFWWTGAYDSAISFYSKALLIREDLRDSTQIGATLNNIGIIYWQWANYNKALEYYLKALNIKKKFTGNSGKTSLMLNNIGMVYQRLGNYKQALDYYFSARLVADENDFNEGIAYSNYNIGSIKNEKNNLDSALIYFTKSLSDYNSISHNGGKLLCLSGIGEVYVKLNKFRVAIDTLSHAITLAKNDKAEPMLARMYSNIGKAYWGTKDNTKAKDFINRSLEISQKINQQFLTSENYKVLSDIEYAEGKYKSAYKNLENHKSISDSIFSKKQTEQIAEMQSRFETHEREAELKILKQQNELQRIEHNYNILLLSGCLLILVLVAIFYYYRFTRKKNAHDLLIEKNQIITTKNEQLKELNATKDKLFSIISHDLKNPFQILQQLTEILSEESGLEENERIELIKNIELKSRSTYSMIENLLTWASISMGKIDVNLKEENLNQVIQEGVSPYLEIAKKKNITINNNIPQNTKLKLDPYLVKTVVGNLVNNSIKFTNENGKIDIKYSQKNGTKKISIVDNGIGMDKELISKLFRIEEKTNRIGTNSEKGSGIGLILCKEFVEKAGGEISIESETGVGTSVTIVFQN
ncbi:MAG: tetratricopeptide repeat-containing sensor histidine kinase [Melioribacteraceae bacterium]|nr:tetratricopeptide repeat-containing sensor histidine kinase [Melioribacteraceae bacterium]